MRIIELISPIHFLHFFLLRIIIYKSKNHYTLNSKGDNNYSLLRKLKRKQKCQQIISR